MYPKRQLLSLPELPGLTWRQRAEGEIIVPGDYFQTTAGWFYLVQLDGFMVGKRTTFTPFWTLADDVPQALREVFMHGLKIEMDRRQTAG